MVYAAFGHLSVDRGPHPLLIGRRIIGPWGRLSSLP